MRFFQSTALAFVLVTCGAFLVGLYFANDRDGDVSLREKKAFQSSPGTAKPDTEPAKEPIPIYDLPPGTRAIKLPIIVEGQPPAGF